MHFLDETENACVSKRYIKITDGRISAGPEIFRVQYETKKSRR